MVLILFHIRSTYYRRMFAHTRILAAMSVVMASSVVSAQTPTSQAELVTVENYNRAQTDVYFAGVVKNGGFTKFRHGRERPEACRPSGAGADQIRACHQHENRQGT